MSVCTVTTLSEACLRPATVVTPLGIERTVQLVLCSVRAPQPVFERRRTTRHPFPYPLRLIPLAPDGTELPDEAVFVLGKHLSHQGLDFYAGQPLSCRRATACFECGNDRSVRLLMDLAWCRFCRHGWYEHGGRFLPLVRDSETAAALVNAMT